MFLEILLDTVKDTYLTFPFLYIMYYCLEYFEHHQVTKKIETALVTYGPLLGACLGSIPQCGFGVLASLLFIEKRITLGTLISVFIATSDEAFPILFAYPQYYSSLLTIILIKCIFAIIIGYLVDFFLKKPLHFQYSKKTSIHHHTHSDCIEALIRTCKVYFFIFGFHFVFTCLIKWIGSDTLAHLLLHQTMFQPVISALFGFIPNCVASVVLTQLYIHQMVSFASLISGLITNAGLGILILIQKRVSFYTILQICFILFISAIVLCLPMQWFLL